MTVRRSEGNSECGCDSSEKWERSPAWVWSSRFSREWFKIHSYRYLPARGAPQPM